MTRQLLLVDFIAAFGDDPGVLPDGLVLGSGRADWLRIVPVIEENGWDATWNDNGQTITIGDLDNTSQKRGSFALRPTASVQINFFPDSEEILFDIDLREFASQHAVDALSAVIAKLGSALGLPVVLSSEGDYDNVVVRYDPTAGEFSRVEPRQG